MTKAFDSIQHAGNGQLDAVTMDLTSFTTIFQAIVADGTDYMKKSAETRLACVEKLLGAKSFETSLQAG